MNGLAELSPSFVLQRHDGAATISGLKSPQRRLPPMKPILKKLLDGIPTLSVQGQLQRPVNSIIADSRRVMPGALFFALEGQKTDGNLYIEEAIDRGAVAVISASRPGPQKHITFIQVEDPRAAMASISKRYFGAPDELMRIVGITGTNGKTTVSWLLQCLLQEDDELVGLLGTIHYDLGKRTLPAFRTTPESLDLYALLKRMHEDGCRRAVMEVSSHALEQKRVNQLAIRTAVFLNLTRDHLDFHGDMESYFKAKLKMFDGSSGNIPENAVVNLDDPLGEKVLEKLPGDVRSVTFGEHPEAIIRMSDLHLSATGIAFNVHWPEGRAKVYSRLPGRYNASNILAALAIAWAEGYNIESVLPKLAGFEGVPGRMERIEGAKGYNVFVDYAHTDDALENALVMLREITDGRLLVVFGCGGDRDRTKRASMTEVVLRYADQVWATADNPRSEPLSQIFGDMEKAVSPDASFRFVDDRRQAIDMALGAARPGDCVLIAGKGHEAFQEFADTVVPFDDRAVARELLQNRNQPTV